MAEDNIPHNLLTSNFHSQFTVFLYRVCQSLVCDELIRLKSSLLDFITSGKSCLINALQQFDGENSEHLGKQLFSATRPCLPGDLPSSSPEARQKLISGVYGSDGGNNSNQVFKMEHSALQGRDSQWNMQVKYKPRENKASPKRWVNVWNFYPDAKVELKHNEIDLTISEPNEDHEFAVFGTPEIKDKKRMQMGIFGGKPTQGKHWNISVTLFDDTMMAFKRVCEREESKGRRLLTTLAGLLVSNSDEDIKIDINALEDGWKIIGSNVMTIKSKDAWNSPENSTDFPCCVFEIAHVDETKQSFFCGIQASHLNDTAETELVVFFEQEQKKELNLADKNFIAPPELTISEDYVIVTPGVSQETDAKRKPAEAVEEEKKAEVKAGTLYEDVCKMLDDIGNVKDWRKLGRLLRIEEPKITPTDKILLHWNQVKAEVSVFIQMLVFFVGCFTGSGFDPHVPNEGKTDGSSADQLESYNGT